MLAFEKVDQVRDKALYLKIKNSGFVSITS